MSEENDQQAPKQQYEAKVLPYQEFYAKEIEAEYAEIAAMRAEDGGDLPKKRIKSLQQGVQLKYKKMFNTQQQEKQQQERQTQQHEFTPQAEDQSLPKATRIRLTQNELKQHLNTRVEVHAWCHRVRIQSRSIGFLVIRDGHGFAQAVLSRPHLQCQEATQLHRETAVMVRGFLKESTKAFGGFEIETDYWELIGTAEGDFENYIQKDSGPEQRARYRHFVHRGERGAAVIKLRNRILQLFREFFDSKDWTEVTPPTIVNTCCEGGSSLFCVDYYGDKAYLTQSSQLYLESVLHACGDIFCIMPSYRAEKANTRRHLAEFTHLETEHAFIKFEDLLTYIEEMVVYVANKLQERYGEMLRSVNENPVPTLKRPFRRMTYVDALQWLNERGIKNDQGQPFQFGDDIAESQERQMIDTIGEPVLLIKFPATLKSFYMARCAEDERLTESVDLLLPTVGEIVGGSMRLWRYQETISAYERDNIPLDDYYWYTDVRRYGAHPHGGMGLGVDRFACWLLGIYNIRDAVLYPRAYGQLMP